jgi:hypothetical protein
MRHTNTDNQSRDITAEEDIFWKSTNIKQTPTDRGKENTNNGTQMSTNDINTLMDMNDPTSNPRRDPFEQPHLRRKSTSLLLSPSATLQPASPVLPSFEGKSDYANLHFIDVPETEWSSLFAAKAAASVVRWSEYYSTEGVLFSEGKARRGEYLQEMIDFSGRHRSIFGDAEVCEALISLFKASCLPLGESLSPPTNPSGEELDPEEDEPIPNPAWIHLQLVYDLFLKMLDSPTLNVNLAKSRIDMNFVTHLLVVFESEDPREREAAKTILHRIYGKFLSLRGPIRRAIQNVFHESINDDSRIRKKLNLSELLEILGSIINGFAVPLREEHVVFLKRTLLPLHKARHLSLYYAQLAYCIVQFVEKDNTLAADPVIPALLRMWPRTNSVKEVMFLNEIEEILDIIPQEQFNLIRPALFKQLAKCISSSHFQVAERTLFLWNNEYIVSLMRNDNIMEWMSVILPPILDCARKHWNRNVQTMAMAALKILMDIGPGEYDAMIARLEEARVDSVKGRLPADDQGGLLPPSVDSGSRRPRSPLFDDDGGDNAMQIDGEQEDSRGLPRKKSIHGDTIEKDILMHIMKTNNE